ncbi:MAG: hypothetical protein U0946_06965 [Patescibacteria group bacterium]|nr:hypothetical protein [Patescibacteria group bacterium]
MQVELGVNFGGGEMFKVTGSQKFNPAVNGGLENNLIFSIGQFFNQRLDFLRIFDYQRRSRLQKSLERFDRSGDFQTDIFHQLIQDALADYCPNFFVDVGFDDFFRIFRPIKS